MSISRALNVDTSKIFDGSRLGADSTCLGCADRFQPAPFTHQVPTAHVQHRHPHHLCAAGALHVGGTASTVVVLVMAACCKGCRVIVAMMIVRQFSVVIIVGQPPIVFLLVIRMLFAAQTAQHIRFGVLQRAVATAGHTAVRITHWLCSPSSAGPAARLMATTIAQTIANINIFILPISNGGVTAFLLLSHSFLSGGVTVVTLLAHANALAPFVSNPFEAFPTVLVAGMVGRHRGYAAARLVGGCGK